MAQRLSLSAAEAYTQIPASTLRSYVSSGRLKAARSPNNRLWFSVEDLDALFTPVKKGKLHA